MPSEQSHWYLPGGETCHEVKRAKPGKNGEAMRATTLADARKLGLLPSFSTIKRDAMPIGRPLLNYIVKQGIIAVTTAPDVAGEVLDAKIDRVLDEGQHEELSQASMDLGSRVHHVIAHWLLGIDPNDEDAEADAIAAPAIEWLRGRKEIHGVERSFGNKSLGYGGTIDAIIGDSVIDFKTTGADKLPKSSWPEHRVQLACYAWAWENEPKGCKITKTINVYLSTKGAGEIAICENIDWQRDYMAGFEPAFALWRYLVDWDPRLSQESINEALDRAGL